MRHILPLLLGIAACAPVHRQPSYQGATPRWISVRFDSSRILPIIPSLIAPTDTSTVSDIKGLGGEVLEWRRDTLLIRPTYVVIRVNEQSHPIDATVRRRGWDDPSLPNLLLVQIDSKTLLERYQFP